MVMFNLPKKVYFKNGCLPVALRELSEIYGCTKALLVSDVKLKQLGHVSAVRCLLEKQGLRTTEFFSLQGIPTFALLESARAQMEAFAPDVIVGVGGGSAMSAAKALWALQENPGAQVAALVKNPEQIGAKGRTKLVLVATSFGSGRQNSPFALLQDAEGNKCLLTSFALLPEISVTDSSFTKSLTAQDVKTCAQKLLTMALAAKNHKDVNAYATGLLDETINCVKAYLDEAEKGCPLAREKLSHAAALAGSTYGNVFTSAEYLALQGK